MLPAQPGRRHALLLITITAGLGIMAAYAFNIADPETYPGAATPDDGILVLHAVTPTLHESDYRPVTSGQSYTFRFEIDQPNITHVVVGYTIRVNGPDAQTHPVHSNVTPPDRDPSENRTETGGTSTGLTGTSSFEQDFARVVYDDPPTNDTAYPTYDARQAMTWDAARHSHTNGTGTWTVEVTYEGGPQFGGTWIRANLYVHHFEATSTIRLDRPSDDDPNQTEETNTSPSA